MGAKDKITYGRDTHFYTEVAVSNTNFPDTTNTPDGYAFALIAIEGPYANIRLDLVEGGSTVYYSFNGTTVHGKLVDSTNRQTMEFKKSKAKIWFKVDTGSATVLVEAYAA